MELLDRTVALIKDKGYEVVNIDSTIIAQRPKLAPYIDSMRESVAKTLNINIDRISIKATTEEGLGFTGKGEGISAQSICLITLR